MISPVLITLFLPSFAEAAKKQTFLQPLGPSANLKEYASPGRWYRRADTKSQFDDMQSIGDIPNREWETYRCYQWTKTDKKITSPASANRSCQEAGAEGGVVYAIKLTPEDSVNPFVEAFVPGGKDNASRVEVQKKRDGSCYVALVTTDKDHENRGLASVLMAIALKVFRTSKSPYANLVNASGTNYMKRFEESGAPWTEKNCGEYTAGTRAYVTAFELAGYTLLATGTGGKKMGLDESRGAITTLQKQCEAKNLEWLANYEASFKNMYAFF